MGVESRVMHRVETAMVSYRLSLSSANNLLSRSTSATWSMSQKKREIQQKSAGKA
jgi:hypothetical protein